METFKTMKQAKDYYPERLYKILTDAEADEAAREYILDTAWAFRPRYLSAITGLPEEAFSSLVDLCEGANAPVLAMIKSTCGLDQFVGDAVLCDGRGHFIAQYDHNETEIKIGKKTYYVYRVD